jgi:hypothetical protein
MFRGGLLSRLAFRHGVGGEGIIRLAKRIPSTVRSVMGLGT